MESMSEVVHAAELAVRQAHRLGNRNGLNQGASRLGTLASVVPSSVTKQWLNDQLSQHAKVLRSQAEEELSDACIR